MAKINKRILCSLCIMAIVLTSLFASVSTFASPPRAVTNTGESISDMWIQTPSNIQTDFLDTSSGSSIYLYWDACIGGWDSGSKAGTTQSVEGYRVYIYENGTFLKAVNVYDTNFTFTPSISNGETKSYIFKVKAFIRRNGSPTAFSAAGKSNGIVMDVAPLLGSK